MKYKQIKEVSIDDTDLDVEFYDVVDLRDSDVINWSVGAIFTKTLDKNTTISFRTESTYLNKVILLIVSGDFAFILPEEAFILNGTYVGTVPNYIYIHCIAVSPVEKFLVTISQQPINDNPKL
ncbi:MAG: hypothetical protein RBT65_12040 [Methanolobus sp.]|jgi:hypothetical protein|nr:hypothetical protein [Methanolobus sp.]